MKNTSLSSGPGPKLKQFVYIVAPFLLLLLILVLLNLPAGNESEGVPTPTPEAQTVPPIAAEEATSSPPALPAKEAAEVIPTKTPQPTPAPSPTARPISPIRLLGPPEGSYFPDRGVVTFYWEWAPPVEDQFEFHILLSQGAEESVSGTAARSEIAPVYSIEIPIGQDWNPGEDITWKITLVDRRDSGTIAESPLRSFRLYVYNK